MLFRSALHIDDQTGSIEVGKFADLVLLNLNDPTLPLTDDDEKLYSKIVYSANQSNVSDVMINGEWKVRNSNSLLYDQNELLSKSKNELNSLLKRVQ